MSPLKEEEWQKLARGFADTLQASAPGWTDSRDGDPGVTLLEVFAFVTEELLFRESQIPERGRSAILRMIQQLATLRGVSCSGSAGLTRVRYYDGQMLTSADFQAEQDYFRAKLRRHNIWMHGLGIVSGLGVTIESSPGSGEAVITVQPGLAIGAHGEELFVCEPLTSSPCADFAGCYVTLERVERAVGPSGASPNAEPSRIEEGVGIRVGGEMPVDGVTIARLERRGTLWMLDPSFEPARVFTSSSRQPP